MDELSAFVHARLDEDEQWALAASKPYPYADGAPKVPEAGVHWQWVVGANWEPTRLDPATQEFVAEPGETCNLASVEAWPSGDRMMPRVVANEIVEMDSAAAGHIARHDPARTLRDVEARRTTLMRCQEEMLSGIPRLVWFAKMTVWEMASRWSDHKEFREDWRP